MSRIADAVARAGVKSVGHRVPVPLAGIVAAVPRVAFRLVDAVAGTDAIARGSAASDVQYRTAAAAVRDEALARGVRTLLVVSATREERRARTTLGVARALGATFGERVCVIDADVQALSLLPETGTAADVPVYAVGATVCALGADAVCRVGIRPLVIAAAAAFRWVLVDAPPLQDGPCSLLEVAEGVLLVVGEQFGSIGRVRATIGAVGRSRVIGAVVTTTRA